VAQPRFIGPTLPTCFRNCRRQAEGQKEVQRRGCDGIRSESSFQRISASKKSEVGVNPAVVPTHQVRSFCRQTRIALENAAGTFTSDSPLSISLSKCLSTSLNALLTPTTHSWRTCARHRPSSLRTSKSSLINSSPTTCRHCFTTDGAHIDPNQPADRLMVAAFSRPQMTLPGHTIGTPNTPWQAQ
jgi:hypothetical protein